MYRRVLFAMTTGLLLTSAVAKGEDFAPKLHGFLEGNWNVKNDDGTPFVTAKMKRAAGGKALVGNAKAPNGIRSSLLAGWDCSTKTWIYTAFGGEGGYVRIQLTEAQGDTYSGNIRIVDPEGQVEEAGCQFKVIDDNKFDIIHTTNDKTWSLHWQRAKNQRHDDG